MHLSPPSDSIKRQKLLGPARGGTGWAVAAAILAASIGVTACGSSTTPSPSARILNTAKVERAIERSAMTQRGERATVNCPSHVYQKQGVSFFCTATVGHSNTRFVVTQLDRSGNVHYVAR